MSKTFQRNLEATLANFDDDGSSDDNNDAPKTQVNKRLKASKRKEEKFEKKETLDKSSDEKDSDNEMSSVIYLGHLPHAFEEAQLLAFFSQFGTVTDVKLSRSKRTGNSKGYAFIKFSERDVASVVAKAMGGYFMMGEKRLVCHVLPQIKVTERLFSGGKRTLKMSKNEVSMSSIEKWQNMSRRQVNSKKSTKSMKKITQRLLKREQAKREKLSKLGIDYEFPGYAFSNNEVIKKKAENTNLSQVNAEHEEVKTEANIKSGKGSSDKSEKKIGLKTNNTEEPDTITTGILETTPVKEKKRTQAESNTKLEKVKSNKKAKKSKSKDSSNVDKNTSGSGDKISEAGNKRESLEGDVDKEPTKNRSNKKLKRTGKASKSKIDEASSESDQKVSAAKAKKTPKKRTSDSDTIIEESTTDKTTMSTDAKEKSTALNTPIKDKNESQSVQTPPTKEKSAKKAVTEVKKKKKSKKKKSRRQSS